MTTDTARGFTIIEVMLFLAITAGVFAALMIGVNAGITQQRYLDSVRSYKALLQNQYSEVLTTRNADIEDWKCSDDGDGSVVSSTSRDSRGTSKCVIIGRAIQMSDGGRKVTVSSVTGYDSAASDTDSDDITAIKAYNPKLSEFDSETIEVDWGAHLTSANEQGNRPASTAMILILRSPTTGVIKVFTSESAPSNSVDVSGLISLANSSPSAVIRSCVIGESGLLPKQIVSIDPRISSPDAVTADGGENEVCQ